MPSSHLTLCPPLLLLPPIPPSIRDFSNESTLHMRWPKYWSFSFSITPSKEIPGLISFRMDWLDLLVVQGTLKSLLQQHSSKASILRRSTYFKLLLKMKKKKPTNLKRSTHTQWHITQSEKRMNFCHFQEHGLIGRHYVNWNMWDRGRQMLYNSIYMEN